MGGVAVCDPGDRPEEEKIVTEIVRLMLDESVNPRKGRCAVSTSPSLFVNISLTSRGGLSQRRGCTIFRHRRVEGIPGPTRKHFYTFLLFKRGDWDAWTFWCGRDRRSPRGIET